MMRGKRLVNRLAAFAATLCAASLPLSGLRAEDGYELWLRHAPLEGAALARLQTFGRDVRAERGDDPTVALAVAELEGGLHRLMVGSAATTQRPPARPAFSLACHDAATPVGGAFRVASNADAVSITAGEPVGCLYAAYAVLRALAQGANPATLSMVEAPASPLRMLNHWDNPDGHVERGYAGRSIFDWWHLPQRLDPRMIDYARANASLGINGVVVNNVNARAFMLEPRYIAKLARLADAWRPYGIRVYLSARFSAPRDIGGLASADPLDPAVAAWWQVKADEIYAAISDFGGFLVKANSEGQPGPQDYGRSHADGANMLAKALGPRGTVIWRAFVYAAENPTDRTMQAFDEFAPLDGQFADNVIVQIKNGPLDFQPREPFHPLFGAMPKTRLMLEAQITKEYLGFASHLAFLAPMWSEVLGADTARGGTVADVIAPVGMAGVANTGSDRNWTGSHFDQANWYAFGRLAWNPALTPEAIAREWAAQTFTRESQALDTITAMMLGSREAVVRYMTPLGLAHVMATGHHYGPGPWVCDLERPDWNPCYYHRADAAGIGFDRTAAGSGALVQYAQPVAARWANPAATDPRFLLWFHRVGWNHVMPSGEPLWTALMREYDAGVAAVDAIAASWAGLASQIDEERHRSVGEHLAIQQAEARWWRDASISYWQSVNGLALPAGSAPVTEPLSAYQAREFPEAPGQ